MEQCSTQPKGLFKATKLRQLQQLAPVAATTLRHVPAACDVSATQLKSKVFVSRRRTEHTTLKSPLKMLQGYFSRSLKKQPQSKAHDEGPETVKPTLAVQPSSDEQPCKQIEPLEEQEARVDSVAVSPPSDSDDGLLSDESIKTMFPDEQDTESKQESKNHMAIGPRPVNWHVEPKRCSVIFLPTVRRHAHGSHGSQRLHEHPAKIQAPHVKPVKEADLKSTEDRIIAAVEAYSLENGEPSLRQRDENSADVAQQEAATDSWGNWMSQAVVLSKLAEPMKAGFEKLHLLRVAISEGGRESLPSTGPSATSSIDFEEVRQQAGGTQEGEETNREEDEPLPLMVMTPRVAEPAPLPLSEMIQVNQNPTISVSFREGMSASLTIITKLLEKVVTAMEGSTAILSACGVVSLADECQIVVDSSNTQAPVKSQACSQERERERDTTTEDVPVSELERQTRLTNPWELELKEDHEKSPTDQRTDKMLILNGTAEGMKEHQSGEFPEAAVWDSHRDCSSATVAPLSSQPLRFLPFGSPASLSLGSSLDAGPIGGKQSEQRGQPSFPTACTQEASLLDSIEDTAEVQLPVDEATMTSVPATHGTHTPDEDEKEFAALWTPALTAKRSSSPLCVSETDEVGLIASSGKLAFMNGKECHETASYVSSLLRVKTVRAIFKHAANEEDATVTSSSATSAVSRSETPQVHEMETVHDPREEKDSRGSPVSEGALSAHVASENNSDCVRGLVLALASRPYIETSMAQQRLSQCHQRSSMQWTPRSPLSPISEGEVENRESSSGISRGGSREQTTECGGSSEAVAQSLWENIESQANSRLSASQEAAPMDIMNTEFRPNPAEQRNSWIEDEDAIEGFFASAGDMDAIVS